MRSRLVKECFTSLSLASIYIDNRLVWVRSNSGNCKADEFAREGILTPNLSKWQLVVTPSSSCVLVLDL